MTLEILRKLVAPDKILYCLLTNTNIKDLVPDIEVRYKQYKRAYIRRYEAERRASELRATPKWLSKEQKAEIFQIYKSCPEGYHVDHIIPLKGNNVSGLHVPWNLQHLLASDNIKKSNKF